MLTLTVFTLGGTVDQGFAIIAGTDTTTVIDSAADNLVISYNDFIVQGMASTGINLGSVTGSATITQNDFTTDLNNFTFITGSSLNSLILRNNLFAAQVGSYATTALDVTGLTGSSQISDCSFVNFDIAINLANGAGLSNLSISDCQLTGNNKGIVFAEATGATGNISEVSVTTTLFVDSTTAVELNNSVYILASTIVFNNCNFAGNTQAVTNDSATILNAQGCYWDSADGPAGSGPGTGQSISINVDYSPWWAQDCLAEHTAAWTIYTNDTIQPALDLAYEGDEVFVYNGIYSGDKNRDLTFGGKNLYVHSETPDVPQDCVIICDGTQSVPHNGFNLTGGQTNACVIEGFTITGGLRTLSGGFNIESSSPVINNCVILANEALTAGAGVYCANDARPVFTDCLFIGNGQPTNGGAVACYSNAKPIFVECQFIGNSAYKKGGAIYCDKRNQITLVNCILAGNTTNIGNAGGDFDGGAIYVQDGTSLNIYNSLIAGNRAEDYGGAIACNFVTSSASVNIYNSTIARNSSESSIGGGFYMENLNHQSYFRNTIISFNESVLGKNFAFSGGTVDAFHGSYSCLPVFTSSISDPVGVLDLQNCLTVDGANPIDPGFTDSYSGNWSQAGVYDSAAHTVILTDLWSNYPDNWETGELIGKYVQPNIDDARQYLILDNTETTITIDADYGTITNGFSWVGTWEDYQIRDYRLADDSPCIDAGNNTSIPVDTYDLNNNGITDELWPNDLDGYIRKTDEPLIPDTGVGLAPIVDMGAHEFGSFFSLNLEWSAIESTQTVNTPFAVSLTARMPDGQIADWFDEPVNIECLAFSTIDSNETIGTDILEWEFPLQTWAKHMARTQTIYLAQDIGDAARITSLALDVTDSFLYDVGNWTIRLKHTTLSSYAASPAWVDSSLWTTVYAADTVIPEGGYVFFEFDTPYEYNGNDNIMVDFSFSMPNAFPVNIITRAGIPQAGINRTIYQSALNESGLGLPTLWQGTTNPTPLITDKVPNIILHTQRDVTTAVAVTPDTLSGFVGGVWTGELTVAEIAENAIIRANLILATTSDSNYFDVVAQLLFTGDYNDDLIIDFADFAFFANQWLRTDCEQANDFCGETDFDQSTDVGTSDLQEFSQRWLDDLTPQE